MAIAGLCPGIYGLTESSLLEVLWYRPSILAMLRPDVQDKYPIGSTPPITFIPYLVVASFLVSLTGTFATVELLHRRVASVGWRSWVDLAMCSITFGSVAVWCMQFIGNRAIVLGDGEQEIQLYYDVTWSILSAILPIIPIFIGFLTVAKSYEMGRGAIIRFGSLVVCGLCTGGAATMLHYLGNNGIQNLTMLSSLGHIFGAAFIAVVLCSTGFGLFFYWGKLWMDNIRRRILVSFMLALGVCGMHWTAAVGTWYQIKGYHDGVDMDKNINVFVACCLLATSCLGCIILCYINQRHRQHEETRAQQIVLAVALFDCEGRLLVGKTGLMPCQTITQDFNHGGFDDELDTSHPVFQWIFRVTRNWAGISDLIPSMRQHLHWSGEERRSHHKDDSTYFRRLFCVTAEDIAISLGMKLEKLGCLYEDVLTTGTMANSQTSWKSSHSRTDTPDIQAAIHNLELGKMNPDVLGKGQMLLLTRRVDYPEAHRLKQLGYSFAGVEQVSDNLSRGLQIPCGDVEHLMARIHSFNKRQRRMQQKGTYLASFLVQPKPGLKDLEVVVPRANPGQLPMIKLDDQLPDRRQLELLLAFDGLTLDKCLAEVHKLPNVETEDIAFIQKFGNGIRNLIRECPEETLHYAIFSAHQLDMMHGQTQSSGAKVFAFCGIRDIYVQSLQSFTLKTIPFSFFKTYLRSQPGCVDHDMLVKRHRDEFGSPQQAQPDVRKSFRISSALPWNQNKKELCRRTNSWNAERASAHDLANYRLTRAARSSAHLWGVMVMASIMNINSAETQTDGKVEMQSIGRKRDTGVVDTECPTLADELMLITASFRSSPTNQPFYQLGIWN